MNRLASSIFGLTLALTLLGLPSLAQSSTDASPTPSAGKRGGGNSEGRIKMMTKALDLSDKQQSDMRDVFKRTSPGKERKQAIRNILTADQQAKLKAMMKNHGGGGKGGTPAATPSPSDDD